MKVHTHTHDVPYSVGIILTTITNSRYHASLAERPSLVAIPCTALLVLPQAIESEEGGHKVIDVYVLFILHSIGLRKKAVEALFSSKIKGGHFTKELMTTAFGAHATVSGGSNVYRYCC